MWFLLEEKNVRVHSTTRDWKRDVEKRVEDEAGWMRCRYNDRKSQLLYTAQHRVCVAGMRRKSPSFETARYCFFQGLV
jgi:hypothetical protein